MEIKKMQKELLELIKENKDEFMKECETKEYKFNNTGTNIYLSEMEMLTLLNALETLSLINKENKDFIYDNEKDYSLDMNVITDTYNKILNEAQDNGYIEDKKII